MHPPEPSLRRLGHVPALDGLRGYAVIVVMLSHLNILIPRQDITGIGLIDSPMEGGYLGVDIFFVLSGFLITALLLREEDRTGTVSFGRFYARRALRLLPALYLLLLAHAFYTVATDLAWGAEGASIRAAVLYYSNWLVVYDLGSIALGTNHLWSLAVEEQFYLIWPAVLVGVNRIFRPWQVPILISAGIVVVAVHRTHLWDAGDTWLELIVRTDTRADALLMGALLAVLWVHRWTPTGRLARRLAWVGIVGLVAYQVSFVASDAFANRWGPTVFAAAVALVILGLLDDAWPATRVFALRGPRAVGRISYGLYLWHFPVYHAVIRYGWEWPEGVRVVVAIGLAFGFALVSWYGLEQPLQRYRSKLHAPARQPVAA
jgi:peptidoglycan/LPS O-acetylase OafA/YrhL